MSLYYTSTFILRTYNKTIQKTFLSLLGAFFNLHLLPQFAALISSQTNYYWVNFCYDYFTYCTL